MHRRPLLFGSLALTCTAGSARAALDGALKVSGSSMALAAVQRVAAAFTAAGGPAVRMLPSLGTTGGFRALGTGAIDLAVASRPTTSAEAAMGITTAPFASTPLALVTRLAEPARAVTRGEVEGILTGGFVSWPEGTPVRFVRRQPSDSDWDLLEAVSPGFARAVAAARTRPGVPTSINDQDHAEVLERLPGAFGCLALGQVAAEGRRLRPVALDGVLPTIATMESGAWPLAKHLFVAHGASSRPEALALASFLCEPEAAVILAGLDHLPTGAPGPDGPLSDRRASPPNPRS